MMKFELADKQLEQRESKQQKVMAMAELEQKAQEEIVALKQQYEQAMVASVSAGKGITDEVEALGTKVEEAEKVLKRRQQERQVYSALRNPDDITAEEIVREWNEVFAPHIKQTQMEPILKRLLRAKKEIIDATLAYTALNDAFEFEKRRVIGIAGDGVRYKLNSIDFHLRSDVEKHFVTDTDLYFLGRGEMPKSFQHVQPKEYEETGGNA
ncbi:MULTISPECIES: hypothetical protein [unclassified Brevibacillus]|uniref:hypothetical protein n=1 Tax=unclassified Brevibacillus TaxID=2684853 RepID=UPI0035675A4F